jgi:hypothetical protein
VKLGDLIIWDEEANGFKFGVVAGLIIERDYNDDSEPAVLVQFLDTPEYMPRHYYDREVAEWAADGTVRVQHAT